MKDRILELMEQENYHAMVPRQIMKVLDSDDLVMVMKTLNELEDEHLIIHDQHGHYALLSYFDVYLGTIDIKESGFGFVRISEDTKDVFVKRKDTLNALDKDLVYVQITKNDPRGPEGIVIDVVKRNTIFLIGVLKKHNNHYNLKLNDKKSYLNMTILPKNINTAKVGDVVKVIITDFGDGRNLRGKVDKVLGSKEEPGMDIRIMVENAKIPVNFSSDALNEAISLDSNIELNDRIDRTNEMIVTIDGNDAKDFDDAITVKKIDQDTYLLGVYIADVSHYVKVNSFLDIESFQRAFSCYLPNGVIPMLPFELSNELCSLKPNELRYVLACEMTIKDGKVVDSEIFKGVIKSKARLTYENVNRMFEENSLPNELGMLNDAKSLYEILSKKRHDKGSLDFETKEAKIILDEELKAIDVVLNVRGISEKMIEEFMILCNETVTERIAYLDLPFLYRIHEEPKSEKMAELVEIAKIMGVTIPKKQNSIKPLFLQQILEKPETKEQKAIFNHLILRTMAKARYSESNVGHFGLAIDNYTHFTSPIRRYPDLVVHRLIKDYLLNENNYQDIDLEAYLENISEYTSNVEKQIERLERDIEDMKKAEYMQKHLGKIYKGIVSGVQKWGFYVELDNSIEGLVDADFLSDEGYYFDELRNIWTRRKEEKFQIGTNVLVKVVGASKANGTIDFILVEGDIDEK